MKTFIYFFSFLFIVALSPVPASGMGHSTPGCEIQKPKHPPVPKKSKKVKEPKEPKKPKTPKEPKKPKAPPKPPWMK